MVRQANPISARNDIAPLGIRLLRANVHQIGSTWGHFPMVFGFWRLYAVDQTGATLSTTRGTHNLVPNHIYLIPANLRFTPSAACLLNLTSLHFEITRFPSHLIPRIFPDVGISRQCAEGEISRISTSIRSPSRSLLDLQNIANWAQNRFLMALASRPEAQWRQLENWFHHDHRLNPVLEYMERFFPLPISNGELAGLIHCSSDHLLRLFREELGTSPMRHLETLRMRHAAEQLIESDASIERIAENCGFRDRYYFTRVFSRRHGIGPAAFRRHHHAHTEQSSIRP